MSPKLAIYDFLLDPATGTGGYLLEVLRVIDRTLRTNGDDGTRGMRLRQAATSRVFGFEILPAPFVVAHLQIATLLTSLGSKLAEKDRPGVYLTNSLTGWKIDDIKQLVMPQFPALASEADAAAHVKHNAKILVVLGNPPYRAQSGVAEDEEQGLLAPYYVGLTERYGIQARGITDLYVRFFRFAERQIVEQTGRGIVSFISNNSWLEGLSHPIMRERIAKAFDTIWIDNLNGGGTFQGSRGADGKPDRSVFEYIGGQGSVGITVPTAVACMVRGGQAHSTHGIQYRSLWGQGYEKRQRLASDASLSSDDLAGLYTAFNPTEATRFMFLPGGTEAAYLTWPSVVRIFPRYYAGVTTARDENLVAYDRDELERTMQQYYDSALSDDDIARTMLRLMESTPRYEAPVIRSRLLKAGYKTEHVQRYYYRPMDLRWVYWEGTTKLLDEKRADFFEQVFDGNLFFEARQRQPKDDFDRTMVTPYFADNAGNGRSSYFPLLVRDQFAGTNHLSVNIDPELLVSLRKEWASMDELAVATSLFFNTVAITQSPQYGAENGASLYRDWPRIPIPRNTHLLEASAGLGRQVGNLLRPEVPFSPSPELRRLAVPKRSDGGQFSEDDLRVTVRYNGVGRYEPPVTDGSGARPSRLWWNDVAYWENVPPEVWAFTIGGYPVVKKWLDYRHIEKLKRPLRLAEVSYVGEMVRRIATLIALGPALDANYEAVKANTLHVTG
jgi:predicted helicase